KKKNPAFFRHTTTKTRAAHSNVFVKGSFKKVEKIFKEQRNMTGSASTGKGVCKILKKYL
ncbi:MAG: hypothetical protein K2H91_10965, partial [Lachnospiraceae bacterium]|nr:hypothetical protein [Lachnospiraceae bacterium]